MRLVLLALGPLALGPWAVGPSAIGLHDGTPTSPAGDVDARITRADLERHVRWLAADEREGRATGSSGGQAAARYLAEALARAGVEPAGDDGFLQAVALERRTIDALPELVLEPAAPELFGGGAPLHGADFDCDLDLRPAQGLRVVRVGAQDELPSEPDAGVALFVDAPSSRAREWVEGYGEPRIARFGLLLRPGSEERRTPRALRLPRESVGAPRAGEASWLRANGALLTALREGRVARLSLATHARSEPALAHNVVGLVRGTAEPGAQGVEALVVSAHYDHIGTRAASEGSEGGKGGEAEDLVYNGADDNASGTAGVLELAEAFAADPPAHTVVFLLATGEEIGLVGTEAYIERPAVPLARTLYNLNLEMIGRPDPALAGKGVGWLVGWELTDVGPRLADLGIAIAPDPHPEQGFFYRSDNMAFVRRDVVAQSISSYSLHEDYHRVSDEADTLDWEHLEAIVRATHDVARLVADGALRPAWREGVEVRGRPRR